MERASGLAVTGWAKAWGALVGVEAAVQEAAKGMPKEEKATVTEGAKGLVRAVGVEAVTEGT